MIKRLLVSFVCALFVFINVGIAQTPTTKTVQNSSDIFNGNFVKSDSLNDYTGGGTNRDAGLFRSVGDVLFEFLNRVMVIIAIGYLTWGGVKLLLSRGNDDSDFTQRKSELFAVAIGFVVFLMGQFIVDHVFFGSGKDTGKLFRGEDPNEGIALAKSFAQEGWIQLEGIFDFATSFVVAVAVLYLVVTAFQLVLSFGNEEAGTKMKNRIIYTILGIVLVTSVKHVVKLFTGGVPYGELGNINNSGITNFFVEWGNMIIGVLGLVAVLALIWAGFILIAGFGSDSSKETAKKIVMYVIIALVLLLSSWTLIYFVGNNGVGG